MTLREYEALVILKSAGTEQELARVAAQLEEPIKKVGGQLGNSQSLGRRKLAYRIARQTEGHYHLLRFQLPTEQVRELDRLLRLNDAIVRFIILSAEDVGPLRTAARPARPTTTATAPPSEGAPVGAAAAKS